MNFLKVLCLVLLSATAVFSEMEIIDLNGNTWTVKNSTSPSYPACVPGQIHVDLLKAGIIKDPNYRNNDADQLWVGLGNWTYSRTFQMSLDALYKAKRIILIADGLDTVASVFINGHLLGSSQDMFRRFIWDMPVSWLNAGSNLNTIEVKFINAPGFAKQKMNNHPYFLPCSDDTVQNGLPSRNYIRKEQCSFSWDWGPVSVTQGIWKSIKIVAFSDAFITDVIPVITQETNGDWSVKCKVVLQGFHSQSGQIKLHLDGIEKVMIPVSFINDGETISEASFTVPKNSAELWWPNQVGSNTRRLYLLTTTFNGALGDNCKLEKRIGFRTFQLVQEPIFGENGLTFYFKVNGQPVYSKGANFIPADSFHSRVSVDDLKWLLGSMIDANMNSVRVWGGGVYASDEFYEVCDELGLMVWQEFMFACAMYPRTKEFLNDVRHEVIDQVRRIASHPSLVMFGGNNENEAAFGWFPETVLNPKLYAVDYSELYVNTVRDALLSVDKFHPFIPSSPSNMALVETDEEYVMRFGDAQSSSYGDVHYYNYNDDCWDVNKYPRPRFASEYGFQSFPSLPTMEKVLLDSDLSWKSPAIIRRQHHAGGQDQMMNQIKKHFHEPQNSNTKRLFDDQLYLSQVYQAMCMKIETEHYRRIKTEAHTMGTLYWQLEDIWQAPTWASIEYGGNWKILHNYLSNIFKNFLVSAFIQDAKFGVYVVNDYTIMQAGNVKIEYVLWKNGDTAISVTQPFSVDALSAKSVLVTELSKILAGKATISDGVFVLSAVNKNGEILSENVLFPASLSNVTLIKAPVSFSVTKLTDTTVDITLQSLSVAPFVFLQSEVVGKFNDNGILLRPGIAKVVRFIGRSSFDIQAFTNGLTVRSLSDTY